MMYLRELNDEGIQYFDNFLVALHRGENLSAPVEILTDERYSCRIGKHEVSMEKKKFENKLELVTEIERLFKEGGVESPERSRGLFAWLSLFYFESVCKKDRNGDLDIEKGKDFRLYYIPDVKAWNRYYRHKILGPYKIYKIHQDYIEDAKAIFGSSPDTHSELMEQIASRQEIITNRSVVRLLTELYWDGEKQALKKGHASKNVPGKKSGGGSVRRLATVIGQLNLTYDLVSIGFSELYSLLPKEFNKFKNDEFDTKKKKQLLLAL